MKEKRTIIDYLNDIKEYSEIAIQFTEGLNFEEFEKDFKTKFATVRALEVVGEATRNIPENKRKKYPYIPWKFMAGIRNIIAHEYFGIDYNIVLETTKIDLPELLKNIIKVIEEELKFKEEN